MDFEKYKKESKNIIITTCIECGGDFFMNKLTSKFYLVGIKG